MRIFFNGRPVEARESDTIAAALYRAGRRVFTRSFKYHRPRGLLCAAGRCPNCLVNVDGVPNVRACMEPARDGMRVRHQNAFPSLETDLLSVIDPLGRFFPVGFYHKTFIHPWYWRAAEPVIRRIAGLGVVGASGLPASDLGDYEHQFLHAEVAVVGGGPAGMAAALATAGAGAEVILADDQPELGGQLRTDTRTAQEAGDYSGLSGVEIGRQLAEAVEAAEKITVLRGATVFGCYEGLLLGVAQGKRLIHLRAQRLVVATGAFEHLLVFRNNDLPGVMLGSAAQRLIRLHGIQPGKRALVVTNSDFGASVACDLLDAGVEVVGVADGGPNPPASFPPREGGVPGPEYQTGHGELHDSPLRRRGGAGGGVTRSEQPEIRNPEWDRLLAAGVPLLAGRTIQAALGRKQVSGAVTVALDANGRAQAGTEQTVACDSICLSTGRAAANGLLYQSGGELAFHPESGLFLPSRLPPNVFAAGEVAGAQTLGQCLAAGREAGLQAAEHGSAGASGESGESSEWDRTHLTHHLPDSPDSPSSTTGRRRFVCFCMDVTEKDLRDAVREGFDELELLKRYATVGMGPCQGKMCGMANVAACARETGKSVAATGTTTARPPLQPVSLGALAGPSHHPVRRTPMHDRHLALGARMMDMGEWKRPLCYGGLGRQSAIEREYRAVRERVGLIDVSTLGKLEVKGRDAGALLDRVYTHLFSNLRPGRARYAVLCDDAGVIVDDGTVTRLGEDHYFVTTTTGNIEFVEQWLTWWSAGTGKCVHVTNVTAGYASMNLAGPAARETLRRLTDADLSPEAFPQMAAAQAMVAGVPALLVRLGFVGETGWEIHVPAEYGAAAWDALLDAGAEAGIAPFGVEAQRLLRLEKKHPIVGVDTDALTNPLEADLAWVIRWEKEDFIGKRSLARIRERGLRNKLAGFIIRDDVVPPDGSAIVRHRTVVGRVTSCRYSPHAGRAIGLGWVPVEHSTAGVGIQIAVEGRRILAEVVDRPFYDPEGARLRG